ncbi:MAG: hypothetical protein ACRDRN_21255 [Sciscionella sp.]
MQDQTDVFRSHLIGDGRDEVVITPAGQAESWEGLERSLAVGDLYPVETRGHAQLRMCACIVEAEFESVSVTTIT